MDFLTKLILLFNRNLDSKDPKVKTVKNKVFLAGLLLAVGLAIVYGVMQLNYTTNHLFLFILLAIAFLIVIFLVSFLQIKSKLLKGIAFLSLLVLFLFFLFALNSEVPKNLRASLVAIGFLNDRPDQLNLHFFADSAKENRIETGKVRVQQGDLSFEANLQQAEVKVPFQESQRGDTLVLRPEIPEFKTNELKLRIPHVGDRLDIILQPQTYKTIVKGYIITQDPELFNEIAEIEWGGEKLQIMEDRSYYAELPFKPGLPQKMIIKLKDGTFIVRNNEIVPSALSHEIVM